MTLTVAFFSMPVIAEPSYENYTYSYFGIPSEEPQAYLPNGIVTGASLGLGDFNNPNDLFVAVDGKIYIADSGNNRIIVLNKNLEVLYTIKSFDINGVKSSFANPCGIFVTSDNDIYIADSDNGRVVVLDANYNYKAAYGAPKSGIIAEEFVYKPVKVVVDQAKRIFVVSQNVNKGLIELDNEGNFISFFGAIKVSPDLRMVFWRMIATKEQKARMPLELPTEYSSVDIDNKGFVYSVVKATGSNTSFDPEVLIRKLNPLGNDVLNRNGFWTPMGDVMFRTIKGVPLNSRFADICIGSYGIYSAIDTTKGRIFTYDDNGNLLAVFGKYGQHLGEFGNPVAIEIINDTEYLVLDSKYNQIVRFKPTDYMNTIHEAVRAQYKRQYEISEQNWTEVLKNSSKFELAYNGKGKALYRLENYKDAMTYFKLGNDRVAHSYAFKEYRTILINQYFTYGMLALIILLFVLVIAIPIFRKYGRKREK